MLGGSDSWSEGGLISKLRCTVNSVGDANAQSAVVGINVCSMFNQQQDGERRSPNFFVGQSLVSDMYKYQVSTSTCLCPFPILLLVVHLNLSFVGAWSAGGMNADNCHTQNQYKY
jgi:hypothetical protein